MGLVYLPQFFLGFCATKGICVLSKGNQVNIPEPRLWRQKRIYNSSKSLATTSVSELRDGLVLCWGSFRLPFT